MWNVLKQDDPSNIMWQLFRLEVEKMVLPSEKINLSMNKDEGEKKDEK